MTQMSGLPLVIVTGAAGGIGQACARLLGQVHPLLLSDRTGSGVEDFSATLRDEGYLSVEALTGDLGDATLLDGIAAQAKGRPFILVNCAGLSPSLADWSDIMRVNLVATHRLVARMEQVVQPGSVAILISSAAGYRASAAAEAAMPDDPLSPDFLDRVGAMVNGQGNGTPGGAAGLSYMLSKRGVHLLAERRAVAWGRRGARIVSVSPTLTQSPMGLSEIASTPSAKAFIDSAPMGRMGTSGDIAMAVEFLASERARFITGCDLRVDGGAMALTRHGAGD